MQINDKTPRLVPRLPATKLESDRLGDGFHGVDKEGTSEVNSIPRAAPRTIDFFPERSRRSTKQTISCLLISIRDYRHLNESLDSSSCCTGCPRRKGPCSGIVSAILSRNVHTNVCPIPNGFQDRSISMYRYYYYFYNWRVPRLIAN